MWLARERQKKQCIQERQRLDDHSIWRQNSSNLLSYVVIWAHEELHEDRNGAIGNDDPRVLRGPRGNVGQSPRTLELEHWVVSNLCASYVVSVEVPYEFGIMLRAHDRRVGSGGTKRAEMAQQGGGQAPGGE